MSSAIQHELTESQKKLLSEEDVLNIFMFLTEREATFDQLCNLSKLPKLRVSYILKKLTEHNLIMNQQRIGSRNVVSTTYKVAVDHIDLSPVVENDQIASVIYLTNKVQFDLKKTIPNCADKVPKVSYISCKITKESYETIYTKLNELAELINELEEKDSQNDDQMTDSVVLFLSLYSPSKSIES